MSYQYYKRGIKSHKTRKNLIQYRTEPNAKPPREAHKRKKNHCVGLHHLLTSAQLRTHEEYIKEILVNMCCCKRL